MAVATKSAATGSRKPPPLFPPNSWALRLGCARFYHDSPERYHDLDHDLAYLVDVHLWNSLMETDEMLRVRDLAIVLLSEIDGQVRVFGCAR